MDRRDEEEAPPRHEGSIGLRVGPREGGHPGRGSHREDGERDRHSPCMPVSGNVGLPSEEEQNRGKDGRNHDDEKER